MSGICHMNRSLILGIGNTLLSDEGAGVHVIEYLQSHYPDLPDVTYIDGGTLSFTLSERIEETENLIVIDAAFLNAAPGTVACFVGEEMDAHLGRGRRSVHEVGLVDLLSIAHLTGHLPRQRALVGIQPANLDWGHQPSLPVQQAIPMAAHYVLKILHAWSCNQTLDLSQTTHTSQSPLTSQVEL